jgi:hypothetical protein
MPINKKKKPTLTKALRKPVKRISPREISQFKNIENQETTKARLKTELLRREGKRPVGIQFKNKLTRPTINIHSSAPNPFNLKKTARVTPGLPTVSRNKVGKGIVGQQKRELLRYQRTAHSRILQMSLPRAGYVPPGKGGYPSHTVLQRKAPRPAVTATRVGVAKIKRRKK